ncbi:MULTISPECIES: TerD family protein [Polymorphospora]|uniref:TerD family protein n=1 Tax=Polymorphospora TaxID=338583 RepID=UPI0034115E2C
MAVQLTKGQRVSLEKPGGTLTRIRMGLGWDAAPAKGFFGKLRGGGGGIDLDASCLLLDGSGRLLDQVWWRQLRSKDNSIVHTGDNTTGEGDGDDESIIVELGQVPAAVQTLVFTVNSFTGEDFSRVANAYCRVVDETNGSELARFTLTGSGTHTALVMARVNRQGAGWALTAIGAPGSGRTFQELMPLVAANLA